MVTVTQWTGRETKALRQARRMSIHAFAAHLGVSERMVSKWEAAGDRVRPNTANQAALDTSLATAPPEARARFCQLAADRITRLETLSLPNQARVLARHPIDGKLMVLVDAGPYQPPDGDRPVWLPAFYIDVRPTTCDDFDQFVADTGHRRPPRWPGGDALAAVAWADAHAYAAWASKALPTPMQLHRVAGGTEGVVTGHLNEWCIDDHGRAYRFQRTDDRTRPTTFRTAVPADQMLALLAI